MAKLKILEFPDPRLRIKAKPVESVDDSLRQLIDDMFETMYDAPGIGLAATQVDVHRRLLVADVSSENNDPWVLINPEIIEKDGIDLLLQRQAVIHAEPTYSITAQVTDKLNQLTAQ